MYPTTSYELAKARVADLHHQAQRDALARAARRGRRAQTRQSTPHVLRHPAFGRRVLSIFHTRTT
jgi:hypothetical protein